MKQRYVKSPLNYTGGKYKLLKHIIPEFPKDINTFVDLFGGGGNILANVTAKNYTYNDIEPHVVELLEYFYNNSIEDILFDIEKTIAEFELSKTNEEGYLSLREYYNYVDDSPHIFYCVLCHAFNYQIRFNKKGMFNMPFGKNRSSFNPALKDKLIDFVLEMQSKKILFTSEDFEKAFAINILGENDLVYVDPPYFSSVASYNENGGWTEDDEKRLLNYLDRLNEVGVKFALSNNLKYNNPLLEEWKQKYNVKYLYADYSNCSYHKKDKSKDIEVLIKNY